jgi:SLT domain-containing protein/phage-related protein
MDSLNQISDAGIPIYDALASHFGVSRKQLNKMVKQGKVGVDDLNQVMKEAPGKLWAKDQKAAAKATQTFGNQAKIAWDNIKQAIGKALVPMLKKLAPLMGKAGKAVADGIGKLPKMISGLKNDFKIFWGAVTGKALDIDPSKHFIGLTKAAHALKPVLDGLKKAGHSIAGSLKSMFHSSKHNADSFGKLIDAAKPIITMGLKGIIKGIALAFKALAAYMRGSSKFLGMVAGAASKHKTTFRAFGTAVLVAVAAWKAYQLALKAKAGYKAAVSGIRGINAAMRGNVIGIVITALAALAAGLIYAYHHSKTFRRIVNGAFRGVKRVASAVVGWFTKKLVPFFTKTLPHAFHTVVAWIKKHWNLVGILAGPVGLAVTTIIKYRKQITHAFRVALNWVKGAFRKAWSKVSHWLSAPVRKGSHAIGKGWRTARHAFSSAKSWVLGKWHKGWTRTKGFMSASVHKGASGIKRGWHTARHAFSSAKSWVLGKWHAGWTRTKGFMSASVHKGASGIQRGWRTARHAFSSAKSWVLGKWHKGWTRTRSFMSASVHKGASGIGKGWHTARRAFSSAKSWVGGKWHTGWTHVKGWMASAVQKGRSAIGTAWSKTRHAFGAAKSWVGGKWYSGWKHAKTWLSHPVKTGKSAIHGYLNLAQKVFGKFNTWGHHTFGSKWSKMTHVLKHPIQSAKTGIHKIIGKIKGAFRGFVTSSGKILGKLEGAVLKPIRGVRKVINKYLLAKGINWILTKLGLKDQRIPHIPKFRSGGPVRGPGGPTSDQVPMLGSNGEHMWTAKEVKGAGGHGAMQHLRSAAAAGQLQVPGYAKGGPVPGGPSKQIGGNQTWRTLWHLVHGHFPGARLTSAYRPGAKTTFGTTSYHALGKAIDVVGPMHRIFNWIRSNYAGKTAELIHSQEGKRQIRNGQPHMYTGAVRRMHFNHVHWAVDPSKLSGKKKGGGGLLGLLKSAGSFIKGAAGNALGFLKGLSPFKWIKNKIAGGLSHITGGGAFGKAMRHVPGVVLKKAKGWISDHLFGGGGDAGSAASGKNQKLGHQMMLAAGFGKGQWGSLQKLWQGESGWNANAVNKSSGAYGIPQALGHGHPFAKGDARAQIAWGLKYIKSSYGTPSNAYHKWLSRHPHWYANGTNNARPGLGTIAEHTPELVMSKQTRLFQGGEKVVNGKDTQKLLGGGPHIDTVNVYGNGGTAGQVVDELDFELRKLSHSGANAKAAV